jgi:hypothetical protein
MQRARAAFGVTVGSLQKTVGAALSFDRVCRFFDETVAAKARDFRIDCVVDVLDGSLDAGRVVWIERSGNYFILERL